MRPVSLLTLENRVRQRSNLIVASNSALYPQSQLDDDINEGIAEFWDLIASVQPQDYALNEIAFNTINGKQDYDFIADLGATDFFRFRGVDVTFGQNIVITCRPFMWSERNRFKWYPGWIYSQPVFYRLIGNAIRFIPTPDGQYNCIMYYTPTPPKLLNPTDTIDGYNGWEEYIVLSAAIKALTMQERFEHVATLRQDKAEMKDRIQGMAQNRDAESPERVQDVTLNDGWIGRPGYV